MEQVSGWSEQGGSAVVISGTQGSGSQRFQQSFRSATVTVRDSSNNLATIYSDDLASPTAKANPFTASSTTGSWSFFTTTGTYTLTFSGGSILAPFSITVNVGLGNSGGIPSYAFASLPTSKTQNAGDIARVTNTQGGLWMDSGVQWVQRNALAANIMDAPFNARMDDSTDDTAAINAAVAAVGANGVVIVPSGKTCRINGAVVINCHLDARGATFNLNGGVGTLTLGSTTSGTVVSRKVMFLPNVTNTQSRVTAWADAASIGVNISNLHDSEIHIPNVVVFKRGVKISGVDQGSVGNRIYIGMLNTSQTNLYMVNGSNGWANSNAIIGGSLTYDSSLGTNVSGTRNILLEDTGGATYGAPNCNAFIGTLVEGNVQEYMVYCMGGYNHFQDLRYEASTAAQQKIHFDGAEALNNRITGGYEAGLLNITQANSATRNSLITNGRWNLTFDNGSTRSFDVNNTGNSNAVWRVFPAAVDVLTASSASRQADYTVSQAADRTQYKATGDAFARIYIDHAAGRIYFGDGTADATLGPSILISGGKWSFDDGASNLAAFFSGELEIDGALNHDGSTAGFFGTAPVVKPTVTGSRGGNAALASLLTALAGLGLLTDSSS